MITSLTDEQLAQTSRDLFATISVTYAPALGGTILTWCLAKLVVENAKNGNVQGAAGACIMGLVETINHITRGKVQ